MSPEYAMHGQFSEKSDVFSFGVIVLEIVSAKRNARRIESHDYDDLLSTVSINFLLLMLIYIIISCSKKEAKVRAMIQIPN